MRDHDYVPKQLSEHFSEIEATVTQHRDLDNSLPPEFYPAVVHTAQQMEKVRTICGDKAINVNSWYRSPSVNFRVGSKSTSAHTKGEAVDFWIAGLSSLQICKLIISAVPHLDFDQLILEHTWVHIAFNYDPNRKNRNQVLSLLDSGAYSIGLTNRKGVAYK